MSNLIKCFAIIFILFSFSNSQLFENEDETKFMDERDALNYADQSRTVDKRWLYTGKEQRREAKENYEEKCERKLLSAAMQKPRWCPELETWPAWNQWRAKDGVIYSQINNNQINGPRRPGQYPPGGSQRPYPNNPNRPNNPYNPSNNDNFNRVPYNPNNPNIPFDPNNQYPGNNRDPYNRDPYNQRRPQQPNQNYPFKQ